jgi:hypothetical protein
VSIDAIAIDTVVVEDIWEQEVVTSAGDLYLLVRKAFMAGHQRHQMWESYWRGYIADHMRVVAVDDSGEE